MPEAAIIIPHYNDITRLMRCLAALLPTVPAEVEVVVIDNGSSESLGPLHKAWPELRVITEPRKGAACARNRGVRETTAPLLFFLDCDCVPAADWLARALHVAEVQLAGRADLVGGAISVFDETPPPRNGAQAFEAVFAFDNAAYVARKGFSVTANLLTRRDVFDAVGDFIPGLSEDLDWCHRARTKGFRLAYDPQVQVAHPSRGDWVALRKKWRRLTDEAFGVHGNTARARLTWALKALAMPISILAHALRVLASPRLQGWGERRAGLAMLVQVRFIRSGWMMAQALGWER